jgi:hydroxyquinol 1,2-dioxygenase
VHFLLDGPGYEPLITHLFQEGAQYLDSDVVFGTKQELVVAFEPREPGAAPDRARIAEPWLEARYDFVLQPLGQR